MHLTRNTLELWNKWGVSEYIFDPEKADLTDATTRMGRV
jgi:hypothetical protein